ncbi:hypothetical protein LUZ60_016771 [Juncus effusus]|nr:hypothetical protein LUZ60_016771 [Juncus effusus]
MSSFHLFLYISFLFSSFSIALAHNDENKLQNYIVIVRRTDDADSSALEDAERWHTSLLSTVCKDSAASRLIYSYSTIVNGFAARLTEQEVESMSKRSWFVRATLANKPYKLMTTHTPDFLGVRGSSGVWTNNNMGEGIIIGVIDSGISPGHPSFNDEGMPPPPSKWKGHCDFNASVCNNKLIGAKSFLKAGEEEMRHLSPFDVNGHGTHAASIAAGAFVENANVLGNALGVASGMAPKAHLAIYRVCNIEGCPPPDIMKAIEAAVNDGVDIISLSLGSFSQPLYEDPIAIGGYFAIMKGIFVSCSAGNFGPKQANLSNEAPWHLTVTAGTTDRQITSIVKLGNDLELNGTSYYQPKDWKNLIFPLVYLGLNGNVEAGRCLDGTLNETTVLGKIVICDYDDGIQKEKGETVLMTGGVGMILVNSKQAGYVINPDYHVLPASLLNFEDGEKIKDYIQSATDPTATFLFKGTVTNTPWSSMIADFSSRGPNKISPLIVKPDITGPGVNILGAIPPNYNGNEKVEFEFMSGTSMATPHLSGIAALIKKAHPNWSPAAIKSAIMTTAYTTNQEGNPISDQLTHIPATPYDMGSGHVDPSKAMDPGLVYDLTPEDYIPYLCSLGYTDRDIATIIHPKPPVQCKKMKIIREEQLNYPSISMSLGPNRTITIRRTVTNVGEAESTYNAVINVPKELSAKVMPKTIRFKSVGQMKRFKIVINWAGTPLSNVQGELKWISDKHVVRSPIAIFRPPISYF